MAAFLPGIPPLILRGTLGDVLRRSAWLAPREKEEAETFRRRALARGFRPGVPLLLPGKSEFHRELFRPRHRSNRQFQIVMKPEWNRFAAGDDPDAIDQAPGGKDQPGQIDALSF